MLQAPSASVAQSLLLAGRNSVYKPDLPLRPALQGPIRPDGTAHVGIISEVKICRTVRELSQSLQGQMSQMW
jgi:hypothetical protein